ncbi:MAG: hypothetical protein J1D86_07235 [Alistipes sp.]|nr:hypothetical protein [Alistipes sp.]
MTIKRLSTLILAAALLAACTKESDRLKISIGDIVGTWVFTDDAGECPAGCSAIRLYDNNTYRLYSVTATHSGRYEINGNTVTATASNGATDRLVFKSKPDATALVEYSGDFAYGKLRLTATRNDTNMPLEMPREQRQTAPQALLFYFVGTNLDYYFGSNISDVKSALGSDIPGDSRIAYFRRSAGSEWSITEIVRNPSGAVEEHLLKSIPNPELSDMRTYLGDMVRMVPAESYGVVFGGHGSGWLPVNYAIPRSAAPEAALYPFGQAPLADAMPTRYFGEPVPVPVMFDIDQIADNMTSTGAHFSYVIFDDCFMSNIESLYAMRNAVDYIIASPCEIMAAGFPYKLITPHLFTDGGRSYDLESVCRSFYEYYQQDHTYQSACVAMAVCSRLEALAAAAKQLFASATAEVDASQLQTYEPLSKHLFFDMMQYAEALEGDPDALDEFRAAFDSAFPENCRLHTDEYYSAYNNRFNRIEYYSGVTISEPSVAYPAENQATEWYRATH